MYFDDRVALGKTLSEELKSLRGKDAVILCIKESSLLTCLTIAQELRAWIYPLAYAPVFSEGNPHQPIGAFDQLGNFCINPEAFDTETIPESVMEEAQKQKDAAMKSNNEFLQSYELQPEEQPLVNRHIIIAGDVITSTLPLGVALKLIAGMHPAGLALAVGSATPAVADMVRSNIGEATVLDVLSGVISQDEHYFQRPDSYTIDEKRTLARHIATYWK